MKGPTDSPQIRLPRSHGSKQKPSSSSVNRLDLSQNLMIQDSLQILLPTLPVVYVVLSNLSIFDFGG